jgi:hypothetical protein
MFSDEEIRWQRLDQFERLGPRPNPSGRGTLGIAGIEAKPAGGP